jgi:hypothetical protein
MFRISKQIVRIGLLAMLFQFLSPAFVPLVTQEVPTSRPIAFSVQHSSLIVPMLLKEKDEKEDSELFSISDSPPLLDLTSHTFNLSAAHKIKYSIASAEHGLLQPPLFSLFCTLLI